MKKVHAIWLAGFSFLVGLYSAHWAYSRYTRELELALETHPAGDRADVALRALQELHQDRTNTIPYLETQLDDDIDTISKTLKRVPRSEWSADNMLILAKARAYRTKFPWESGNRELDNEISNAFLLLDTNVNADNPSVRKDQP
jgi:hypothetical protein